MTAPALPDLAQAIEREHRAARAAASTALQHALECGRLLLEAKDAQPHGEWLPWLKANCSVGQRAAQGYMRLARELPRLEPANAERIADLSLRDALGALARQSADLRRLPASAAAKVLDYADDARLRDSLVRAVNDQKRAARRYDDQSSEWTTIELPPSLPPPDAVLIALLTKEIERHGLPPMVVLESLNALYCRIQNRHQLVTRAGLPAPLDEDDRVCLGQMLLSEDAA